MKMKIKAQMKKDLSNKRRGAAVIEFALVLPILLLIMGGIMDYARAYMELQMMANAASEGARMAIVPGAAEGEVENRVRLFLPRDGDTVVDAVIPAPGEIATVTVERRNWNKKQIFLEFFSLFGIRALPDTLTYTAHGRVQGILVGPP